MPASRAGPSGRLTDRDRLSALEIHTSLGVSSRRSATASPRASSSASCLFPLPPWKVLANARQDSTLASARRALRLIGAQGDVASISDAAISSLEARYPRPSRRGRGRGRGTSAPYPRYTDREDHELAPGSLDDDRGGEAAGSSGGDTDDTYYRRRCLAWLKPKLPTAWILNEALMGRVPEAASAQGLHGGGSRERTASRKEGAGWGVGRSHAIEWVSAASSEARVDGAGGTGALVGI